MPGNRNASVRGIARPESGKVFAAHLYVDMLVGVALERVPLNGLPGNTVRAKLFRFVSIRSVAVILLLPLALATKADGSGLKSFPTRNPVAFEHRLDGCNKKPQQLESGLQGVNCQIAGPRSSNQPLSAFPALMLPETDMTRTLLWKVNLQGADLQGADLQGADLREAKLQGADLREAELGKADLRGADLRGADLRRAMLQGADLRGADLQGADLQGANLRDARLQLAKMKEVVLLEADTTGANFSSTILVSADLSASLNLTQVQIDSAFGDASTILPDHLTRPDRWPDERLAPHEIYDSWRAWLRNR